MPDSIADSIRWWSDFRAQQPVRDAQLADILESLKEKKTTFSQKQQSLATEGKYAYPEVDKELSKHISDALAPGGSLAPSPNPPPSDQGVGVMTFPFAPPANIAGTPRPLVTPGGPTTAPAPGQPSQPGLNSRSPGVTQLTAPNDARALALVRALANAGTPAFTVRAPGPGHSSLPPSAPATGAPSPQGPASAPSAPPASPAPAGPPAGWSPMPKPMTDEGIGTTPQGGPSIAGRAIDPVRMPSVAKLKQRMDAAGVDPIIKAITLDRYKSIDDEESKKILAQTRIEAEVFRSMVVAGNARLRALQAEDAQKNRSASLDERVRHDKAMEGRAAAGGPTGLSEGAIDLAASQYLATGQMPPLGFSSQALREAILNRAAVLQQQQGTPSSQVPGKRAEFKSNQTALTQVTKDLSSIAPYQAMLEKNTGIAIDLAEKIYKANVPLANRSINWLSQNVAGDPDVAEYLAQIRIVQTEAARVLNNPRLVGQLTDSARHEMEGVVNGNMNLSQTKSVLGRLKQDGENRVNAMQEQSEKLRESLGAKSTSTGSPASKSPPAAGTIKDGYMFNGGDPSKKENWSKVQ